MENYSDSNLHFHIYDIKKILNEYDKFLMIKLSHDCLTYVSLHARIDSSLILLFGQTVTDERVVFQSFQFLSMEMTVGLF